MTKKVKYIGEKDGLTVMPSLVEGERQRDLSFKRGKPKEVEDIEADYLLKEHAGLFEIVGDEPAPEPAPVVEEEVVEAPAEETSVEEEPKVEAGEVVEEPVEESPEVVEEPKDTTGKIVLKRAGV